MVFCFVSFLVLVILLLRGIITPKLGGITGIIIVSITLSSVLWNENDNAVTSTKRGVANFPPDLDSSSTKPTFDPNGNTFQKNSEITQSRNPEPSIKKKESKTASKNNSRKLPISFEVIGIIDESFVKSLEAFTGYTAKKKGDYRIEIDENGALRQDSNSESLQYIYSGGNVIVKVNDEICCCQGLITIEEMPIPGENISEVNQSLDRMIIKLLNKHQKEVIVMIANCLPR